MTRTATAAALVLCAALAGCGSEPEPPLPPPTLWFPPPTSAAPGPIARSQLQIVCTATDPTTQTCLRVDLVARTASVPMTLRTTIDVGAEVSTRPLGGQLSQDDLANLVRDLDNPQLDVVIDPLAARQLSSQVYETGLSRVLAEHPQCRPVRVRTVTVPVCL